MARSRVANVYCKYLADDTTRYMTLGMPKAAKPFDS